MSEILNKRLWKGCSDQVDKCNEVHKKRLFTKLRLQNKRIKILAVTKAIQSVTIMKARFIREFAKIKEKDLKQADEYRFAHTDLMVQRAKVRAGEVKTERDKIIKKLNL